jgi:hypothetical protein
LARDIAELGALGEQLIDALGWGIERDFVMDIQ